MKQVGKIYGPVQPTSFKVLLTEHAIERGSYVKVPHEVYGWVLARITGLKRYLDDFDDEVLMAEARTIGYLQDGAVLVPKTPFKPEENVYLADKRLILSIIGIEGGRQGNLYLGYLEGHNVPGREIPVYLDVKKTIGKHVSVLAKTGAGKSYTVAVLLEELLKTNTPVVVVDSHGEYASLGVENDDYELMKKYGVKVHSYAEQITEYVSNPAVNPQAHRIFLPAEFDMMELTDILPMRLGDRQKNILYEALQRLGGSRYSLRDLIEEVEQDPSRARWKVVSGLEMLLESGVFDGPPLEPAELVKPGTASILNLKGTEPRIQQLVVAKVAKELFDERRMGHVPELLFLVEEAHNFCPERGFGDSISSTVLRSIASEGRKFGFRLCVVSQRPARVDKNVLSQCNTQFILKVTNPNDLRAIGQSIEGFTPDMESEIRELPVGHALVVGECVEQPITVDVRARETRHGISGAWSPPPRVERRPEPPPEVLPEPEKKRGFWDFLRRLFVKDEIEVEE